MRTYLGYENTLNNKIETEENVINIKGYFPWFYWKDSWVFVEKREKGKLFTAVKHEQKICKMPQTHYWGKWENQVIVSCSV